MTARRHQRLRSCALRGRLRMRGTRLLAALLLAGALVWMFGAHAPVNVEAASCEMPQFQATPASPQPAGIGVQIRIEQQCTGDVGYMAFTANDRVVSLSSHSYGGRRGYSEHLGTWNTTGLAAGTYSLCLDLWDLDAVPQRPLTKPCWSYTLTDGIAAAPAVTSLTCAPQFSLNVGEPVTCSATTSGTVTSLSWQASGGTPSAGSGSTFTTTFGTAGTQTVSLSVCNGSACTNTSRTVTVVGTVPRVTSINCTPTTVLIEQDVFCTATYSGNAMSWVWSAPDGSPSSGAGTTFTTRFSGSGSKSVTVQICDGPICSQAERFVLHVDSGAPDIDSLGCSSTVTAGGAITCSPTISGAVTSYSWTATGGSPSTGSAREFTTTLRAAGTERITLEACNENQCRTRSQTVTVRASAITPVIRSVSCTPASPGVNDAVTCSAVIDGSLTSRTWRAASGSPSSGSGTTFTTRFERSGAYLVTIEACDGSACTTSSTSVGIGAASAATPTPAPTTSAARPATPRAVSPGSAVAPGSRIENTLTPTLRWNAVPGATSYAVAISRFPYGSANIVYNPQSISGTSITLPTGTLEPGTRYRWNLQARNAAGLSAISNTLYIQTDVMSRAPRPEATAPDTDGPIFYQCETTARDYPCARYTSDQLPEPFRGIVREVEYDLESFDGAGVALHVTTFGASVISGPIALSGPSVLGGALVVSGPAALRNLIPGGAVSGLAGSWVSGGMIATRVNQNSLATALSDWIISRPEWRGDRSGQDVADEIWCHAAAWPLIQAEAVIKGRPLGRPFHIEYFYVDTRDRLVCRN